MSIPLFLCSENSDILYFENFIGINLQNIKDQNDPKGQLFINF